MFMVQITLGLNTQETLRFNIPIDWEQDLGAEEFIQKARVQVMESEMGLS